MESLRTAILRQDDWVLFAACRGRGDLFFPPDDALESRVERRRREAAAKQVCASCRVRAECLEEALASRERFGIWGGLTERERRARALRLKARSPQDIDGPGRPIRLPAVVVQGRSVSAE